MKHFHVYPKVEYSNHTATNILVRSRVRDIILKNTASYYDYTVRDHDRPDAFAKAYYGSPDYTWVLFYANNIFDAFYDWPLPQYMFDSYVSSKYNVDIPQEAHRPLGTLKGVNTVGTNLTYQVRNTPIKPGDLIISPSGQVRSVTSYISNNNVLINLPYNVDLTNAECEARDNIHSYYNVDGLVIDFETWNNTPLVERTEKTYYEYEVDFNDQKREIKVLDNRYLTQLLKEFQVIFK